MILLTGANGFLGRALRLELKARRYEVRAVVRSSTQNNEISVGDIGPDNDWRPVLEGVDAVIHTAARAHVMNERGHDSLDRYREVNVEGTLNLARQAAAANVNRFIFISSVKVNGESTVLGKPFTADGPPGPEDAYGISKWEAETGLKKLADETGIELVIIRPPLVYGPGVKANFRRLINWVRRGLPLPLASIDNRRSLVAIDNLVDLIITCIDHPAAVNQVLMVADGHDVSTTELLHAIGAALGKPARLYPCPANLLLIAGALVGKKTLVQRLVGNLQVDISSTRSLLGWDPPLSLEQGLRKIAQDPD